MGWLEFFKVRKELHLLIDNLQDMENTICYAAEYARETEEELLIGYTTDLKLIYADYVNNINLLNRVYVDKMQQIEDENYEQE